MNVLTAVDRGELAELRRRDEFFWLDLRDPSGEDLEVLGAELGLHPMTLEDSREWRQRPKVETYDDYVFLVFYSVSPVAAAGGPDDQAVEVHVYVSGGFILTLRRRHCEPMEELHSRLDPPPDATEDYLVYRILDQLTDAYFPILLATEDRIEAVEAQVFDKPHREQLKTIYRLKQEVARLERRVLVQLDYFPSAIDAILALPGLSRGTRLYLRDVGDHLAHVAEALHHQASDLASLTATFYSANSNKLNRTATRLTVVTTFFVVGSLLTGFFGQNFGWLVSSIESRSDFLVYGVAGLFVPLAVLSAYFWRRRDDWL